MISLYRLGQVSPSVVAIQIYNNIMYIDILYYTNNIQWTLFKRIQIIH